ncbi:MAG: HoxN/HupN/NixA family nickel/cobalt transporter [Candidatus Dormibacteraeota bacterium]|nr:HoxN/HupN/NixA family nickel/cobalt transporter [Candidatus Dormibacteraeota bacterium]
MVFDRGERQALAGCGAVVALLHVLGLALLIGAGAGSPALLGLGVLAYTFGLRHAFDADHIAAIDNVTRGLLQRRRRPVSVGFYFSLGHSTIVFAIALLLALAVRSVVRSVIAGSGALHQVGAAIGTGVSGVFLLLIGGFNLLVLFDLLTAARRGWRGEAAEGPPAELRVGGLFTRLFGRLFGMVDRSWQIYPIGVLFGLGFDTATEVVLLGISAGAAAKGLPVLAVLALPLLFAAGMALMDTADGAFMAKAYAWAFSNPVRKLFYNLSVTSLSVFVALFVGVVEMAQILARAAGLGGRFWTGLQNLNFETLGLVIVAAFAVTWAGAFAVYRLGRVRERWESRLPPG